MAKVYMIKNEQVKRIKANRKWKTVCLVLAALVILEHIAIGVMYVHG
jgi:hypothetical protein